MGGVSCAKKDETYSHHHNLTAPLFALTGAKTTNFQIGDRKEDMFWRVHWFEDGAQHGNPVGLV